VLPFDFLPALDESTFIDADVDTVCSLLHPPQHLVATEWGRAPELRGPGVAMPNVRPLRGLDVAPEDGIEAVLRRAATRMRAQGVPGFEIEQDGSTLTVMVEREPPEEPEQGYPEDDDNDDEQEF